MTFYYTVSRNGIEKDTGTEDRGFSRKYGSWRAFERYFLRGFIEAVYSDCVARMRVDEETRVNVYRVDGNLYDDRAYRQIASIVV